MIDMLLGIVEFLGSILKFFLNTLVSIVWVISSIPSFIGTITGVFAYCPSFLLVFLEISLALTVLFAIIKLVK